MIKGLILKQDYLYSLICRVFERIQYSYWVIDFLLTNLRKLSHKVSFFNSGVDVPLMKQVGL